MLLPSASSAATSKELIEHIFMTIVSMPRWIPSLLLPLDTLFTMLIIYPSLFGVAERLVRVRNRLELFLCAIRVVLVLVRMELYRHLFEGLLDLVLCGASLQTQDLVVVSLSQHCS